MSVGVKYSPSPTLELTASAGNMESAFQFIAYCDSIFKIDCCGNCGKPGPFKFIHRTPKGNDFYEIRCESCHHSLKLSKTKADKKLYPKGWEEPYKGGSARTNQEGESESNQEIPDEQPQTADVW